MRAVGREQSNGIVSKLDFRNAISVALTASMSLGIFLSIPAAHANQVNDPTTYLDENFNQTGYATFSTDVDRSAKTLGVTVDYTSSLSNRRILFTLENGRVILRAFKPTNFSGLWFGWTTPSRTTHPVFGYQLDSSFGTAGKLDLGVTGVLGAAVPSFMSSVAGDTSVTSQPWIVVTTSTANLLYKFTANSLATCGTNGGAACTVPTALNITSAVSSAGHAHAAVNVATTANITLSGLQTIDGVTLVSGNRVLVKDQTTSSQNGIYVVPASGAWTRATDYDQLAELQADYRVYVTNGNTYANTVWDQTATVSTFGTDPIAWSQLSSGVNSTLVTGFSHSGSGNSKFFVSGATRSVHSAGADKPFFVEINSTTGSVAPNKSFVFSAEEFNASSAANGFLAPGLASFSKFVPASMNLQEFNNTLFLAGSLEKSDGSRIGVIYGRTSSSFAPASVNPQVVFNSAAYSTSIEFMTNYGALGGSYKESAQDASKPFMAAIDRRSTNVYFTYRLQSTGAGNLLSISHAANNAPVTYPTIAIASDGGNLRAYTWTSLGAVNDAAPTQTEIISIPGITGSVTSGVITGAIDSAGSAMMPFVTFDDGTAGTIATLAVQSRTLQPALTAAPVLQVNSWPRLFATQGSRNSDLESGRTLDIFGCTAAYSGSSLSATTTSTPAGCTDLSSSLTRSSNDLENGLVDLGNQANLAAVTGFHIVGRLSYSNPNFIYWTASMDFTNGIPGGSSSNQSSAGGSSLTSPAVSNVTPLRGGAQISFTPPAGNPAGTTYRVTALQGGTSVTTATASTSPITVGGLQDGVSYTYRIQAIGPTGTVASAGTTSSAVSTLQPGSTDSSYFSSGRQPGATGVANTVVQPSGNIYVVSTDVRRIIPTGSNDTTFGSSGTYSLPAGLTGTVVDVVEDPATGSATPSVYVLVKETSTNEYKVVKLNHSGVLDTSFGTAGVFTPSSQPTSPANPLPAELTIGQSGPVIEIPGVALPPAGSPGVLGTNFVASDAASGPAGTTLAGSNVVVGLADGAGGSDLVVSVLQTTGGTTAVLPGFNGGNPITVARTSGTTSVGGVAVDAAGNIYVVATVNGEIVVLAYSSTGAALTSFGASGKLVVSGATDARGIEVVGERILITTSNGTNTTIRAIYTPSGFSALTAAVSSGQGSGGSGSSGGSSFTGPVVTSFSLRDLPAGASSQVTLIGERLSTVTLLTIGQISVSFTRQADGGLNLSVPALAAGIYDLTITYSGGSVVTHQAAFRVLAAPAQRPGHSGSLSRSLRFTNFAGDNATLPRSARVGIDRAIKSLTEVNRVVCRGYTSGVRPTAADQTLALRRAEAACNLIKELVPTAETELRTSPAAGIGPRFRSVGIFLDTRG